MGLEGVKILKRRVLGQEMHMGLWLLAQWNKIL